MPPQPWPRKNLVPLLVGLKATWCGAGKVVGVRALREAKLAEVVALPIRWKATKVKDRRDVVLSLDRSLAAAGAAAAATAATLSNLGLPRGTVFCGGNLW